MNPFESACKKWLDDRDTAALTLCVENLAVAQQTLQRVMTEPKQHYAFVQASQMYLFLSGRVDTLALRSDEKFPFTQRVEIKP